LGASLYLRGLTADQFQDLTNKLWSSQHGNCFICGQPMDLTVHAGHLDIDHVEPLAVGGKDDPLNFALTHDSCNRSKQAADLRVARVLARFSRIRAAASLDDGRSANLGDVLKDSGGSKYPLVVQDAVEEARFAFSQLSDESVRTVPIYKDTLSEMRYLFAELPIEYLHHDDRINPRPIGSNLGGLVEEFHRKLPQLHVALAWYSKSDESGPKIKVFDGQHKAAAQVLLGVRRLPVRVFIDADPDALLTANTHAGTTLRQVAFDKSIQRHLGNTLFWDRVQRFRKDRGLAEDDLSFSERDLMRHFKGEFRAMKRYILDAARDSITNDPENRLRPFIDLGGRKTERPLSYSTVERTFYSFFIYQDVLDTALDFEYESGLNPRDLERGQIVRLMNLIADKLLISEFDPSSGAYRVENRVQSGDDDITDAHLRAYRLMREEILYAWLGYIKQIVSWSFAAIGKPFKAERMFQYQFPEPLWSNFENYLVSLKKMPVWVNRDLATTVFGGKQNYAFWQQVFESGKTPQGQQVLAGPLDLMKMVQE
jgi:hypothetical protein